VAWSLPATGRLAVVVAALPVSVVVWGCLAFAAKPVLQTSIMLLGTTLSLQQIAHPCRRLLAAGHAQHPGRRVARRLGPRSPSLGVRGEAQLLIGIGTGICGASAIAATQAVIKAKESKFAYVIRQSNRRQPAHAAAQGRTGGGRVRVRADREGFQRRRALLGARTWAAQRARSGCARRWSTTAAPTPTPVRPGLAVRGRIRWLGARRVLPP